MARNRAEIEIDIQNQGAIASIQALIGNLNGINREIISFKFGTQAAIQGLTGAFQIATGQAQQLEKQILGLTGTFASLSQVVSAGVNLSDPLDKINALQPAIESSIAKVREISLSVSGTTSSELVDLFQIIATNSSQANLSLDQSVELVKSFSAGLVSANIPLFQARQEISSILNSQITQDSALAKQLGITNEIVAREKNRGTLVEFLNERLRTSVAIQEKFSKTIEGAASNVQEIGELTQSAFGGQLLKPITDTLNAFYDFLDANKEEIFGFAKFLGNQFVLAGGVLQDIFNSVSPLLLSAGEFLGTLATGQIQAFTATLQGVGVVLSGLGTVVSTVLTPVFRVLNTDIGQAVVTATLFATVINVGAVGATLKFSEALLGVALASKQFLVLSAARIAAAITEIGVTGLLNTSLKVVIGTQAALASGTVAMSSAAAGAAILSGGLITLALVAAGAAVSLSLVNKQNQLFIEQNEKGTAMADQAFNDSQKIIEGLKRLEAQRLKNGKLSKEEEEDQKKKTKLAEIQVAENNRQIANLKEQISSNEKLREVFEPQIKLLEKQNAALSNLNTTGLKVGQVGSAYAFLAQQAKTALNVINAGVNQEDFDKRSKEITDITKQQVELGLITRQQGIEQLEVVAKNENVKVELRAAAQKQILALIKDFNKEEIELGKAQQAELEQLATNGFITEVESIKKISELKKQALEIDAENARIANQKIAEETAREKKSVLEKLNQELADARSFDPDDEAGKIAKLKNIEKIKADIVKASADFAEKEAKNAQKRDTDQAKNRADLLKVEQEEINKQVKALRGILDRELEENANIRKKAEFALQADLQALKLGGFENDKQLEEETLLLKKQTIEAELFDKRRLLEFDKTLLANFRGSQAEKEALIIKISKQEGDIAKLNLDATDNLIARTKILYDQKINGIEREKESLDKVSKLLQSQNDLQSARIGLTRAIQDAELKAGENRLAGLKEAAGLLKTLNGQQKSIEDQASAEKEAKEKQDNINKEKNILSRRRLQELGINAGSSEIQIARAVFDQEQKNLALKARQFEANQQNEQRTLAIQQQQAEIKDRQLAAEAKLALLRAQESGKTDLIKSALELVNLTDAQIVNNKEIAKIQTESLKVKQDSEREAFNLSQANASFQLKVAGVESGLTANETINRSSAVKIQAQRKNAAPIAGEDNARGVIKANQDERVKEVLADRTKILGEVANGAVAFEGTSQQIAENFERLPKSLKETSKAILEAAGFAKQLSENPLFASREQEQRRVAAAKAKDTQFKQDANKANNAPIQAASAEISETERIRIANEKITANNARITDRNNLGRVGNAIVGVNGAIIGVGDGSASPPIKQNAANEELARKKREADNEEQRRRRLEKEAADNLLKQVNNQPVNKLFGLNRFTGGITPADIPVTVNEQGQEAVTNLRTGETMLLPYGERQVIFGDTSYVHNANDTRQLLTANTSAAQAIADREAQSNSVVAALGRLHDLIAGREVKLSNTNNFYNEPRQDHTAYELTRAMIRAAAV